MKKLAIIITVMIILLISSNAWWLYRSIDFGVSYTHLSDSYQDHKEALDQVLQILPLVAQDEYSKEDIIQKAQLTNNVTEPFEKDGFTWIGKIGIKFDKNGKVTEVQKGWEE